MTIQPIDLVSLLRAVTWPLLAAIALIVFLGPIGELAKIMGRRINKVSVGGVHGHGSNPRGRIWQGKRERIFPLMADEPNPSGRIRPLPPQAKFPVSLCSLGANRTRAKLPFKFL